jgi:hypothetical protein
LKQHQRVGEADDGGSVIVSFDYVDEGDYPKILVLVRTSALVHLNPAVSLAVPRETRSSLNAENYCGHRLDRLQHSARQTGTPVEDFERNMGTVENLFGWRGRKHFDICVEARAYSGSPGILVDFDAQ